MMALCVVLAFASVALDCRCSKLIPRVLGAVRALLNLPRVFLGVARLCVVMQAKAGCLAIVGSAVSLTPTARLADSVYCL